MPHDTYPGQLYILFLSEMKDFDFNTYMISYESDKRIDDLFLNKAYWFIVSPDKMIIQDPINTSNNPLSKSFRIDEVFKVFQQKF